MKTHSEWTAKRNWILFFNGLKLGKSQRRSEHWLNSNLRFTFWLWKFSVQTLPHFSILKFVRSNGDQRRYVVIAGTQTRQRRNSAGWSKTEGHLAILQQFYHSRSSECSEGNRRGICGLLRLPQLHQRSNSQKSRSNGCNCWRDPASQMIQNDSLWLEVKKTKENLQWTRWPIRKWTLILN